jgi:hypothetical protein
LLSDGVTLTVRHAVRAAVASASSLGTRHDAGFAALTGVAAITVVESVADSVLFAAIRAAVVLVYGSRAGRKGREDPEDAQTHNCGPSTLLAHVSQLSMAHAIVEIACF